METFFLRMLRKRGERKKQQYKYRSQEYEIS